MLIDCSSPDEADEGHKASSVHTEEERRPHNVRQRLNYDLLQRTTAKNIRYLHSENTWPVSNHNTHSIITEIWAMIYIYFCYATQYHVSAKYKTLICSRNPGNSDISYRPLLWTTHAIRHTYTDQVEGGIDLQRFYEHEVKDFDPRVDAGRMPGVAQLVALAVLVEPLGRTREDRHPSQLASYSQPPDRSIDRSHVHLAYRKIFSRETSALGHAHNYIWIWVGGSGG